MAMQIRSDLVLPTLRILIAPRRDSGTEALFQVVTGSDTPVDVTRCILGDLGLPSTLVGMDPVDDAALTIPDSVISALQQAVSDLGPSPMPPYNALWLEFPNPRGFLYIMPWERLLQPLDRRLFRLPNHLIRPQAPRRALEIAICTSMPAAKAMFSPLDIVEQLVEEYQAREITVHVFTDHGSFDSAAYRFKESAPHVVVHNPLEAADYSVPDRTVNVGAGAQISNPWLLWMRDAMQGKPLDFVHFVSHGYMSGDQGAIAMAQSPSINTDQTLSRFIGSVELTAFLSQVGAWGLILTGPQRTYPDVRLRELADAVALVRPGVAITHDFARDKQCDEFGLVLRSVLEPQPSPPQVWSAITCWVHPKFTEYPDDYRVDLYLNADGSSAFIADATRQALSGQDTQSWVASATRVLETQQMRWLPDSMDERQDQAAVTALRNVANLVEQHVERDYGKGE